MKNILKPRINYSPLYHHVDDLQEQIFNTKNISSNPHDKRILLLNSLVHVIFFAFTLCFLETSPYICIAM